MTDTLIHADWSTHPNKRWVARARRSDDGFHVDALGLAGALPDYFDRRGGEVAGAVFGFDFPIGVPLAYAEAVGMLNFPTLLGQLQTATWAEFGKPAETAGQISLTRPFYPHAPGGTSKAHLVEGLGIDAHSMLRRCEQLTGAEWLFWTLGPRQVGRAALSGWLDLLQPAVRRGGTQAPVLWPFAGAWRGGMEEKRRVVVETYPGAVYPWLDLPAAGWSKRRQADRRAMSSRILAWLDARDIRCAGAVRRELLDGFGQGPEGEDPFDAVVGLCGMLMVVLGERPAISQSVPADVLVREGWIFGV